MIYLVTSTLTKQNGRVCFNPVTDTEIFPTYISALRWLAKERQNCVRLGWRVWSETPTYRSNFGRETMFCLCYMSPTDSVTRLTISRINTNGFH